MGKKTVKCPDCGEVNGVKRGFCKVCGQSLDKGWRDIDKEMS